MELRYLTEFLTIAKCGNFSCAAEELFVSQASLSKHIKTLEEELGVPLFERTTRSVHLSDYGRLALPFAQEISAQVGAFEDKLQKEKVQRRKSLTLTSIPVMAQYGITDVLYAFRTAHPDIQLTVTERESCQIDELLENGAADLAFKRFAADEKSPYTEIPYCTDELVAILPENHPLSLAHQISIADLKDDLFLLLDENTTMYHLCVEACKAAGFMPKLTYKGHRPKNIIDLVAQGMGVSLLMKPQAKFYKNPGIVCLELSEQITSRISLIYKRNHPLSFAANSFVQFLIENISDLGHDSIPE